MPAYGQNLDLGGAPGCHTATGNITASGGISWSQDSQTVTANGNAQAVRGDVTVTADQLVAHYRKAPQRLVPAPPPLPHRRCRRIRWSKAAAS